jgi:hypothetical protein
MERDSPHSRIRNDIRAAFTSHTRTLPDHTLGVVQPRSQIRERLREGVL